MRLVFIWMSTGGSAVMLENHPLFDQTVTVYRYTGSGVERTVLSGCFFLWEDQLREDELGEHMERTFLLMVPGAPQKVFAGSRVLPQIGPQITAEQWSEFIPAKVDGLCEVAYVSPKYWNGQLCHIEAGRK